MQNNSAITRKKNPTSSAKSKKQPTSRASQKKIPTTVAADNASGTVSNEASANAFNFFTN